MTAIAAEGLTRSFGEVVAVDDVSFAIGAGEVVALLGPNGAGKTTTLAVLEGFLAPSAGRVAVLGAEPRRGDRRWRARIGLVLQSTSLDAELTARDALRVFAGLHADPVPVDEVLDLIDLADAADTRIGRLSGGQQRRVDLGLGLIGRPDVLFLDEPTTGLDPEARRRTWAVVERLAGGGTTVLLTTHAMDEAERLAGRLLVLAEGRLVADATPDALRPPPPRPPCACPPACTPTVASSSSTPTTSPRRLRSSWPRGSISPASRSLRRRSRTPTWS
jgi:ABC-2 type transport system ATP-binding protein